MKWDRAIIQQNGALNDFMAQYLAAKGRNCALILGAGFDPRTLASSTLLTQRGVKNIEVLCLREERHKPQPKLRPIAEHNEHALMSLFPGRCASEVVDIFDSGGGVVGGRRAVGVVDSFIRRCEAKAPLTDVLVDISALSCGVFFPIIAQLLDMLRVERRPWNLHLLVTENPQIDIKIRGEIMDSASQIHGYRSGGSLPQASDHALLWAPVFAKDNDSQMRQIYDLINQPNASVDILPIIPFPGLDARQPDILVEEYRELIGDWRIDPRHFLYAAESDPLDSYRSICEINKRRAATFAALGGSSTILSPLGSKMLSVGLMLAAIEHKMRVVYVECLGYEELSVPAPPSQPMQLPVTHIWLEGDIYAGLCEID